MKAAALVSFRNVRKSYDGTNLVVRDLSLDIGAGEFLTLLGPSGSGKTTTLMLLAGLEAPDAGDILVQGTSALGTAPHRRGIGVVFQSYALFPHLDVASNVAFPLQVRRVPAAERAAKVARALEMVRLGGMGARMPAQLSGGQQQRVALARALVFEPNLVLLDEPLGALDKQLRDQMQLEIRHLQQRLGVTMLYVTHDQAEALTLSDRIAVFAGGVVQQLGTPETLYERPQNAFVARFVGENNRLSGRLEGMEDGMAVVRLACGPVVRARAGDVQGTGADCVVTIRPERVAVAAAQADEMGDRALPARVVEAIYLGDHVRLRLSLAPDGTAPADLTVKRPAGAVRGLLAQGQMTAVAWEPDHACAFRPEP
jgi:putative spermidine/putrescine transport system ATP-binding protein